MNASWILIISAVVLILAYRYFGIFLSKQFGVNKEEKTPSHVRYDGVDFVPAKNWTILFGHHFSSIAGAGPIVGPILAVALWGWMPSLAWILLGSVFFGGVHDFGSLMLSIKHQGNSIADITKTVISKRARLLFVIFVWLALILVIAIFAKLCAITLVQSPKIVLPSIGLIPLAVLLGYLMYMKGFTQKKITIIGLPLLMVLMVLGSYLPVKINSMFVWMIILFIYSYFASITPVQILLQPRDYLSSFLILFGILFGVIGIFITRPVLSTPSFIAMNPANAGMLWPMLFVTIACGAISGFHCLVSSGTTAKQIARQEDACTIGYGGMLLEGGLAVIALICVSAGLGGGERLNYFIIDQHNPIAAFNEGYGNLTKSFLGTFGGIFSATILNAFILTTLDTATRIGRYLTEELFGIKNRYISTAIIVCCAVCMTFSGSSDKIWPVFGASNQLVAALALIVLSCWLLGMGKKTWFVSIPAIVMLITAVTALVLNGIKFYNNSNVVLLSVNILLIVLAVFLVFESIMCVKHSINMRNTR